MAWAANFDDFLNVPVTNNVNWNMQTTGMHNAFTADVVAEPTSIAELYSGMPIVVCLSLFTYLL